MLDLGLGFFLLRASSNDVDDNGEYSLALATAALCMGVDRRNGCTFIILVLIVISKSSMERSNVIFPCWWKRRNVAFKNE